MLDLAAREIIEISMAQFALCAYIILAASLLIVMVRRWLWAEYPVFAVAVGLGATRGFGILFWPDTILYDWWPASDVLVWGFRILACYEVFRQITRALNERTRTGIGTICLGVGMVVIAAAIQAGMRQSPSAAYNRTRMSVDLLAAAFLIALLVYAQLRPFPRADKLSRDHGALLSTQQAWYGMFALIPLVTDQQWWGLNGMFLVGMLGLQLAWIRLFRGQAQRLNP